MSEAWEERLVERLVTYTLEVEGQVIVVEHVPARVNEETGERFFAPATVEKLQEVIRERREPSRVIEAPVFDFAAQQVQQVRRRSTRARPVRHQAPSMGRLLNGCKLWPVRNLRPNDALLAGGEP